MTLVPIILKIFERKGSKRQSFLLCWMYPTGGLHCLSHLSTSEHQISFSRKPLSPPVVPFELLVLLPFSKKAGCWAALLALVGSCRVRSWVYPKSQNRRPVAHLFSLQIQKFNILIYSQCRRSQLLHITFLHIFQFPTKQRCNFVSIHSDWTHIFEVSNWPTKQSKCIKVEHLLPYSKGSWKGTTT